jgi:hypothetical protein
MVRDRGVGDGISKEGFVVMPEEDFAVLDTVGRVGVTAVSADAVSFLPK